MHVQSTIWITVRLCPCRWVSNLSRFLQHVVGQLGRRLTLENSPKDLEDGSDSDSDDGSEAPMSGHGDEQVISHSASSLSLSSASADVMSYAASTSMPTAMVKSRCVRAGGTGGW